MHHTGQLTRTISFLCLASLVLTLSPGLQAESDDRSGALLLKSDPANPGIENEWQEELHNGTVQLADTIQSKLQPGWPITFKKAN